MRRRTAKHYSCCIVDALLVLYLSDRHIIIYLVTGATIKIIKKAESEKENESIMILTSFVYLTN